MTNIAAIDIGSHTARLLVSKTIGSPGLFQPLIRKRSYIRLAQCFDHQKGEGIGPEAIDRTLSALTDFSIVAGKYDVNKIHAVATGVVRRAANRDHFIDLIHSKTDIKVNVISGEREAELTRKGVLHGLNIETGPFVIFDLGGGTTEFIIGEKEDAQIKSLPLGAAVLTQGFLRSDPPKKEKLEILENHVDEVLEGAFQKETDLGNDHLMVGTGGTVTTLAALIYQIGVQDINPERLNGLVLRKDQIGDLFEQLKSLTIDERLRLPGLDQGRADVILAGIMVVIRILHCFRSVLMKVSLSDLLEGILITYLEGEEDGY
jgi:exopolyphosphatase/guanosine-5'-triphosphate,3'-diphosphate pyrophosphatase